MHLAVLVFGQEDKKLLSGSKAMVKAARARKHRVSILREKELYLLPKPREDLKNERLELNRIRSPVEQALQTLAKGIVLLLI